MIFQEEKVSQALYFGSLASHSPFLMEKPSKDLCSSNMTIELPLLDLFLSSQWEDFGPQDERVLMKS